MNEMGSVLTKVRGYTRTATPEYVNICVHFKNRICTWYVCSNFDFKHG